ncbi:hypothetical protein CYMTET_16269 [Cymbomonas tetramitiformis]|uniref:Biotin transporter n=1 Tax=Cymbomonas tetramitiformis TaxID=36881 RepID=A0AAE0GCW0_9CHLO|nr:hypothetical protein CYMTET_16269 [Cymbomonas tetramitiformis]
MRARLLYVLASSLLPSIYFWQEGGRISLFTALGFLSIVGGAQVAVPLSKAAAPVTGQTLAVVVNVLLLGHRQALASAALYVLGGTVARLPILAGGTKLEDRRPIGYLVGMPVCAWVTGAILEPTPTFVGIFIAAGVGQLCTVATGAAWLWLLKVPFVTAVKSGFLPFLPGMVLKAAVAASLGNLFKVN